MPPLADGAVSDFDDFHETPPQAEPDDGWSAFAPRLKVKKEKKVKKGSRKDAARAPSAEPKHDEDTPYAKSVTPSPPTSHGVQLEVPPDLPVLEPETEPVPHKKSMSKHAFVWDEDATPADDVEAVPELPSAPPTPAAVRSPRPPAAKLVSPTVSPPYRPANLYTPSAQYARTVGYHSGSAAEDPISQRRESFLSQRPPRPHFTDPPPPHMPQAHFYGVPDLGLNLTQKPEQGKVAGSDGYCCCFDSLAEAGDAASARRAKDVLLIGSDCGLDVYRITADKMEIVARLEGLRGQVIDAKVLPHHDVSDPFQRLRPLVAAIVHGPVPGASPSEDLNRSQQYQTTVEVYSLQTQEHIATLYRSTMVRMDVPVVGHLSLPPKHVGELSLTVAGRFIVVTSGKSGEVFVFAAGVRSVTTTPQFRCVSKYWTALQMRPQASRPSTGNDASGPTDVAYEHTRVPLMSLSRRWLAIVPPYTSAGTSIQGSAIQQDGRVPAYGVSTQTAPPQPSITCEVAGIDEEGTLSWLSRKAAQGLVHATQRGYEMGMLGWKELTHPSPPTTQQSHHRTVSHDTALFPPTNAPMDDPKRLVNEPALVSLVDLETLLQAEDQGAKHAPAPFATFALVNGCNYLSFSPDGLRLLTSNQKGEVADVWDLAHVAHARAKAQSDDATGVEGGPHVKLIHRITRSSPSVTVDSVWSRDSDRLAVLTARGTVHLNEIPLTAPSKKRKRHSAPAGQYLPSSEPGPGLAQGEASPPPVTAGWASTFRSFTQSLGSQVNTITTQYAIPTTLAGLRETAATARSVGQRAIAKGINQGYTAARSGASDMWHAEDNKIRLKGLQEGGAKPGCLHWVQGRSATSLAVAAGGSIYIFPVQRLFRRVGNSNTPYLKKEKHRGAFPLPRISTNRDGAMVKNETCAKEGPHGFWSLKQSQADEQRPCNPAVSEVTTTASEIETSPPYVPFHVDHRVSIYVFEDSGYSSQAQLNRPGEDAMFDFKTRGHGYLEDEEAWLFGESLPPATRVNERSRHLLTATGNRTEADALADQMINMFAYAYVGETARSKLVMREKAPVQKAMNSD
ncbi:hypothetical protein BAUCODRAFT_124374 [Baudoinia panamericana UAMH 10762]|uniref:Uncharacterized protein n=1 Tax=Baudoinia panamericana (strain UAMH 10762) TaxID=717646 RepID=M2N7J3_BAUPA|nr:uncharacterized protein BAUCODRAFT_124374 [Baudoinia panamericana UAMH 10762]EMC94780.1 hypothetical protein BAUCODRAFT_124374 [Baudoinia panamericana UAMH 10762]